MVLQLLNGSAGNPCMEYGQVNGEIGVDVRDLCEFLIHGHLYAQLLPALPDQGLFFRFAGFYLAACKFPQQSPGFVGGRWQIMSAPPFQSRAATTSVMAVRLLSSGCFQYKSFCRFLQAASCPKQSSPEYWETNGELAE